MKKVTDLMTQVHYGLENGTRYILEKQYSDGTWRDYNLLPNNNDSLRDNNVLLGESNAWITAVVGLALTKPPFLLASDNAVTNTAKALQGLYSHYGWGFNQFADCDADSTAWCIRFLSSIGYTFWPGVLHHFCQMHIAPDGQARTYSNSEVLGSWAQPHQDVTPVVGLALSKIMPSLFNIICKAVLANYNEQLPWRSFWWNTDSYSIARNIELLSTAGLITEKIEIGVLKWLSNLKQPDNAFESAQRLSIIAELPSPGRLSFSCDYVQDLLGRQNNDGSWPSSLAMLLPPKFPGEKDFTSIYSDQNGLMTTASAIYSLKQWISSPTTG